MLHLGEDMDLPQEERGSPPRQKGPPRRGYVRLGEPESEIAGLFGLLRRVRCSLRRTTLPRPRQATLRRACDYVRLVFIACWGWSLVSICDWSWLASGSLYDLFESVIA